MSEGRESASTQTAVVVEVKEQETNTPATPPPSSTPIEVFKPYRFSDHIHKDRHIFLKGASLGIGCGSSDSSVNGDENVPLFDWNSLTSVGGGCFGSHDGYFVDEYGNVFYNGKCVQLGPGMALKNEHLPLLHRVQLSLPSANWAKRGQNDRYPHVHQQHKPTPRHRPFNEQLNTYVDTQKRIRSVHCLEDLYRASPPPLLPFLTTARRRISPRPPNSNNSARTPARVARETTSITSPRNLSSVARLPSVRVTQHEGSSGPPRKKSGARAGHSAGSRSGEAERELASAREALKSSVPSIPVSKSYATYATPDYLNTLAKDGRQGTSNRLFESYPKRVLVHPSRNLLRQRTDLFARSRPQLW
ncbi:hypothetical protein BaRGS_00036302 [Batillaria attramentaria]|uniref:Uncharacterized protein n=1 Tax=Batillaria attramentaria TaxID=370345 RepID=A0ABD0JC86_9CAEN